MSDDLIYICDTEMLSDPGSYGFNIDNEGGSLAGFVVRQDGSFYAYQNSCPHTGAPLDWVEHQFLDADGALIQCAVHDARFFIDSGECVFGPCPGESLSKLDISVRGDKIYLATMP